MNNKKISFIVCSNSEYYMQECFLYLSELTVPEGFDVDVVEITEAKSMAAGYNEGIRRTDAKYKVYLHQDVFVIHKNFLLDMLDIFAEDPDIGMIGMTGTPYLTKNGIIRHGIQFGSFYKPEEYVKKNRIQRFIPFETGYLEAEAVDGLLMATQYDVPWSEEVFQKWDFYDVSQSLNFLKAGYKVVIPGQSPVWYIHDGGVRDSDCYHEERIKFLEYCREFLECRQMETEDDYVKKVCDRVKEGFHGTDEEKEHLLNLLDAFIEEKGT